MDKENVYEQLGKFAKEKVFTGKPSKMISIPKNLYDQIFGD